MKQRNLSTKDTLLVFLFSVSAVVLVVIGCSDPRYGRGPFSLDDEELLPFATMYEVDREQFCLTEIDRDSRVEIGREPGRSYGYDVALHMYSGGVSRGVAFVWENDQYVWIGEQEIHYSGRKYMTPDGELRESIAITYHEREYGVDGMIGLRITYSGDNKDIPRELTCEQASTYIKEWDAKRKTPDNE